MKNNRLILLFAIFVLVCAPSLFLDGTLPKNRFTLVSIGLLQLTAVAIIILGILRMFTGKK